KSVTKKPNRSSTPSLHPTPPRVKHTPIPCCPKISPAMPSRLLFPFPVPPLPSQACPVLFPQDNSPECLPPALAAAFPACPPFLLARMVCPCPLRAACHSPHRRAVCRSRLQGLPVRRLAFPAYQACRCLRRDSRERLCLQDFLRRVRVPLVFRDRIDD
ncbi:hypothetical protein E4U54_001678, partial [Claviceps lovelessii]